MGTRAGEIGDQDTTRFRRSIEWRAHFRFAECLSVPDALGFQSYHNVDPDSNSRTLDGYAPTARRPPSFFLATSLAKNRSSNSHERRSFFNRDRKILRHSHRQLRKIDMELRLEPIAQLAQLDKIFS